MTSNSENTWVYDVVWSSTYNMSSDERRAVSAANKVCKKTKTVSLSDGMTLVGGKWGCADVMDGTVKVASIDGKEVRSAVNRKEESRIKAAWDSGRVLSAIRSLQD